MKPPTEANHRRARMDAEKLRDPMDSTEILGPISAHNLARCHDELERLLCVFVDAMARHEFPSESDFDRARAITSNPKDPNVAI